MKKKITFDDITIFLLNIYIFLISAFFSTGVIVIKIIRILITFFLLLSILKKGKMKKSCYLLCSILFLGYNFINIKNAYSISDAQEGFKSLLYIEIVNMLAYCFINERNICIKNLKAMMTGTMVKCVITYSLYGIFAFVNSRGYEGINANNIGFLSAMCFNCCIFYLISSRKKNERKLNEKKYIILALIYLFFSVLSASRKAVIYLILSITIYLMIYEKRISIKKFLMFLLGIFIIIISYLAIMKIPFMYNLIGNRIENMISGFEGEKTDGSTSARIGMIDAGMEWFKEKPILGYGIANFKVMNRIKRDKDLYAHNNYVELLVDCGIIGTVIYYIIYILIIIKIFKQKNIKNNTNAMILGILITFIICEYGIVAYDFAIYQYMIMLMYLMVDFNEEREKKENGIINNYTNI